MRWNRANIAVFILLSLKKFPATESTNVICNTLIIYILHLHFPLRLFLVLLGTWQPNLMQKISFGDKSAKMSGSELFSNVTLVPLYQFS